MRLVLASHNARKLAELKALFAGLDVQLIAQGDLGIAEAEEPHDTFLENALTKARHAARASGGAAIADDSGLIVPALGGEPGVHSAVYARVQPATELPTDREARRRIQDAANNARLLERLAPHRGEAARRAWFTCTLVALRQADDPEPLVATGRFEGVVLDAARGAGGFGYDPLLFIPSLSASVAELDAETKNRISHRAQAARAMRELLAAVWRV